MDNFIYFDLPLYLKYRRFVTFGDISLLVIREKYILFVFGVRSSGSDWTLKPDTQIVH
jgi:hypothetical protein